MRQTARPYRVTVIRYLDPKGKRVPKGTPGARRVRQRSDTYYASLKIEGQRRRISLETTDLGEACIRLRERQRREALRAAGLSDRPSEQAARPLGEHLEEWLASVVANGTTAARVQVLRARVHRLAQHAGWRLLGDITADSCLKALARIQSERPASGAGSRQGRGPRTRNHYLADVRQFCRWLVEDRRLTADPLGRLRPLNVEVDRRHQRRSPTDDEIDLLFGYLAGQAVKKPGRLRGMSATLRALGYKVAMATGYRAQELRSLTKESFDLEHATVTVIAAHSKHRRTDVLPLPAWLAEDLRRHFAEGGDTWGQLPATHPGRMLAADLRGAGVPYVRPGPEGPLYLDFHALRVWYCTQLANQPGISPKVMMTLCRHATADLTLKTYAKARQDDLRQAANLVRQLGEKPGTAATLPKDPDCQS